MIIGRKMVANNDRKKNENVVTQKVQNKHNPKTKDAVGCTEGQNVHNTNNVREKMVADNCQKNGGPKWTKQSPKIIINKIITKKSWWPKMLRLAR